LRSELARADLGTAVPQLIAGQIDLLPVDGDRYYNNASSTGCSLPLISCAARYR